MQLIKIILPVIAALIALLLLLALLMKKEFTVEKEIAVHKSKPEVFNYIKLLKNQEQYSVWVMKDPNIKIVYTGTDGTIADTSSWESNDKNAGTVEQEIIKMKDGESMEVEIRFKKPFEATNYARTAVSAINNDETKLTILFYGKSKFTMNMMNLFMDKLVGKDIEQNLLHIKKNQEQ